MAAVVVVVVRASRSLAETEQRPLSHMHLSWFWALQTAPSICLTGLSSKCGSLVILHPDYIRTYIPTYLPTHLITVGSYSKARQGSLLARHSLCKQRTRGEPRASIHSTSTGLPSPCLLFSLPPPSRSTLPLPASIFSILQGRHCDLSRAG